MSLLRVEGFREEAVVVIKMIADEPPTKKNKILRVPDEDMVTYPRIKLTSSSKEAKGEGWNMRPSIEDSL